MRADVGVFDVSHMGQVETRGPQAVELPPAARLERRPPAPEGGAQYALLCIEDGGVLDDLYHLPAGGQLLPDGHERRQPRAATSPGCGRTARGSTPTCATARPSSRCSPSRGRTRARWCRHWPMGHCRRGMHCCERTVAGVPMLVCGTGYTGEDGVELLLDPDRRDRGVGCAGRGRRAAGRASARATRCDSRRASTCTATTSTRTTTRSRPGLAGPAPRRPASSAPRRSSKARSDPAGPELKLVPFVIDGPGIPRQGNPVLLATDPSAGGVVTSGTFSPCLERGIGMAYVPADRAQPGTRIADRRSRHRARGGR